MNTVTLGGLLVGICTMVLTAIRWWFKENHKISALVPYLLAKVYGVLAVLTTGGILSGIAGITLWGSSGLGDLALVWGVGGHTHDVTRPTQIALSDGGYGVVLILTVAIVGLWIWAKRIPRGKLFAGILTGVCLGLSGTFAGAAAVPIASAANIIGLPITTMLS